MTFSDKSHLKQFVGISLQFFTFRRQELILSHFVNVEIEVCRGYKGRYKGSLSRFTDPCSTKWQRQDRDLELSVTGQNALILDYHCEETELLGI